MPDSDREANRFSARAARYARVGANMGGVAARVAGARLFGFKGEDASNAAALAQALGGLKGPIMKVAQLLATIPDLVPPEYAAELQKLQSEAPPMGGGLRQAAHAGGVRARTGRPASARSISSRRPRPRSARSIARLPMTARRSPASCNIPTCSRRSRRICASSSSLFALHRRMDPAIDTREIAKEIGERVREELDYAREAKHVALYAAVLADVPEVRVPTAWPDLSTRRLLTLGWLEGKKILDFKEAPHDVRNRLAVAMFKAWWHPFSHAAVIHGDPHLGNYTVFSDGGRGEGDQPARLWLHPHLPSALRRRRRRSLSAASAQ